MKASRFAFVIPRYFEGIAGGAETLMGALAKQLYARGDSVELVATCATDNRTWSNALPAGEASVEGLKITRFEVDDRNLDRWIPIQIAIHEGQTVPVDAQLEWMEHSVNSKAMYRYIAQNAHRFDALFFGPYLFGTTFWGSLIAPSKSILIPCLHDESYAYQEVVASMFRQVKGCLFNADPEMHLARSLYGPIRGGSVGMGFEPPALGHAESLTPFLPESERYILYLGRKETGKNVHLLIDYFIEAKALGFIPQDVKLAVLGGGSFDDLHRPNVLQRGDVVDLPHVSELDKQRLIRHALFLCQPSTNESFSIVLMEAWLLGTPVVVHGQCAVTRHHVVESGGGLYFSSVQDFAGVTRHMLSEQGVREQFASRGKAYVCEQYSWAAVLERFDEVVNGLLSESLADSAATPGTPHV
jgi:glycosyltransferase involved in cell wall biosynthesis